MEKSVEVESLKVELHAIQQTASVHQQVYMRAYLYDSMFK